MNNELDVSIFIHVKCPDADGSNIERVYFYLEKYALNYFLGINVYDTSDLYSNCSGTKKSLNVVCV